VLQLMNCFVYHEEPFIVLMCR